MTCVNGHQLNHTVQDDKAPDDINSGDIRSDGKALNDMMPKVERVAAIDQYALLYWPELNKPDIRGKPTP